MLKHSRINRIFALLLVLLFAVASSFAYAKTNRGDVNGDGQVDSTDAAMILRSVVRFAELNAEQRTNADVDGDGDVTANDASVVLRYAVRVEKSLPVCDVQFTVLVTSDMMGEVWSSDLLTQQPKGSALQAASYIDFMRTSLDNVVVFDAGNSFFGNSYFDLYGGDVSPMTSVFKTMKYDAILLGSEDFASGLASLRIQIEALQSDNIPVLAANVLKNDPTTADAENAPWNGCLPFIIKQFENRYGESVKVGIIGLTDTTMEHTSEFDGVGGLELRPMLETYKYYEPQLKQQCDIIIALAHCNIEADAYDGIGYDQSVRSLIENTDSIDLVLCGHTTNDEFVPIPNKNGTEIAVMGTGGEVQMVCRAEITFNTLSEQLTCAMGCVDTSDREDITVLYELFKPIADRYQGIASQAIGALGEPIEPVIDPFIPTGWMTLLHRSHIHAVETWRYENEADLPGEILSITYPYVNTDRGLAVGSIHASDLFERELDNPSVSLIMVQGCEIRQWLDDYAKDIKTSNPVYSLYGLNYRLEPREFSMERVDYLEHTYGVEIGDNETFALILVEKGEAGSLLRPYLDEGWLTWEERIIPFEVPAAEHIDIPNQYQGLRMIIDFLSNTGAFTPIAYTNWSIAE